MRFFTHIIVHKKTEYFKINLCKLGHNELRIESCKNF